MLNSTQHNVGVLFISNALTTTHCHFERSREMVWRSALSLLIKLQFWCLGFGSLSRRLISVTSISVVGLLKKRFETYFLKVLDTVFRSCCKPTRTDKSTQ